MRRSDKDNSDKDNSGGKNDKDGEDHDSGDDRGGNVLDLIVNLFTPTPAPETEQSATPSASPSPKAGLEAGRTGDGNGKKGIGSLLAQGRAKRSAQRKLAVPSASPSSAPELDRETESVTVEERYGEGDNMAQIKTVKPKTGFFKSPTARLITITAGSFAILAGLFALLYFLRWSVRVFNDDGNGRLIYLGRCRVNTEEDGYAICISQEMSERAVSNRYCIRPGLFGAFRTEEEELAVCRGQKRVSVPISREMIVVV